MRVAALSYDLRRESDPMKFYRRVSSWVKRAKNRGVDVLVLPELIVLEMLAPELPLSESSIPRRLEDRAEQFVGLLEALADQHDMTIVGGSHIENNKNVCAIVSRDGVVKVEKEILTQWEQHEWRLQPGDPSPAVLGEIGVSICYDVEFPELVRRRCLAGVRVLCVPFFTETHHGFHRVEWSCRARALENQVFVAQAALIGGFGMEPAPSAFGASMILCPSCEPFPCSGTLARTPLNRPGLCIADLDFDALDQARNTGDVRNWNDFVATLAQDE